MYSRKYKLSQQEPHFYKFEKFQNISDSYMNLILAHHFQNERSISFKFHITKHIDFRTGFHPHCKHTKQNKHTSCKLFCVIIFMQTK